MIRSISPPSRHTPDAYGLSAAGAAQVVTVLPPWESMQRALKPWRLQAPNAPKLFSSIPQIPQDRSRKMSSKVIGLFGGPGLGPCFLAQVMQETGFWDGTVLVRAVGFRLKGNGSVLQKHFVRACCRLQRIAPTQIRGPRK